MTSTILVVDDEPLVRVAVAEMLKDDGYEVLEAETAYQALDVAGCHSEIVLLLTDVNMPNMTGLELAKRLYQQHPNIRLVVMSGRQYLDDNQIPDDGTFLPKPFTYKQLLGTVEKQLGHSNIH